MTVAWLWLYGPPGVGKSATGFELFERMTERGDHVAFVELDQIGMCMAASVAARSETKAENLLGLLDNFAAAGVAGVVVSGDIVETMSDLLPRARERPVLCRLRAEDEVTIDRLTIRGSVQYAMSSRVYESHDVPPGDLDVTTHPLDVHEVAEEILRRLGSWPPEAGAAEEPAPPGPAAFDDAAAVLITGPRVVGTSTVAWQVLMASVTDHCTGYLDLDQLGFLPAALQEAGLATRLANVATCWRGFRAHGARRLVLCGHPDGDELGAVRDLLPSIRVVALTAAPDTLLERARRRSRHKDLWLPGDDLFGRDDDHLREVVDRATAYEVGAVDLVLDTEGFTPTELAARVAPRWPAPGDGQGGASVGGSA